MNSLTAAVSALGMMLVLASGTPDVRAPRPEPASTIATVAHDATTEVPSEALTDMVQQYCQVCHNDALMTGNCRSRASTWTPLRRWPRPLRR